MIPQKLIKIKTKMSFKIKIGLAVVTIEREYEIWD